MLYLVEINEVATGFTIDRFVATSVRRGSRKARARMPKGYCLHSMGKRGTVITFVPLDREAREALNVSS